MSTISIPQQEKKTKPFVVLLTPSEHQYLKDTANQLDISAGELVRYALERTYARVVGGRRHGRSIN